jgi:hypothetical protein
MNSYQNSHLTSICPSECERLNQWQRTITMRTSKLLSVNTCTRENVWFKIKSMSAKAELQVWHAALKTFGT